MKKSITPSRSPTEEEIARVAYFFYEERGREPGHEVEDWLRAEAHVCTDKKHVVKAKGGHHRGQVTRAAT